MARMRTLLAVALVAGAPSIARPLGFPWATKDSAKEQKDPLAARVANIERQQADTEAKLAELAAKENAHEVKLAEISGDVHALGAKYSESSTAAKNAELAAARAETAAAKAAKVAELDQRRAGK